jgi:transcriptional regulator with XRE-family HTH domain
MNKSPNQIDIHIGTRIRMRRMMLNMSQSALGQPCGITFQQIQKYEKGANRVGASRLQEFSKLLGVPVAFFFEGLTPTGASQKNAKQDLAQELLATRHGIELIKAFMSIRSKSLRRAIIAVVEEIAKQH